MLLKHEAMMKSIKLLMFVFAFVFFANSNAEAASGSASCRSWSVFATEEIRHEYEAWLYGYLAGIAHGMELNFMAGTEQKQIILWMDQYCKKKPLDYISDGGNVLANELIEKMH